MDSPVDDFIVATDWLKIAAQYPAAAGREFISKSIHSKPDSLIWDPELETLWSCDLNDEGLKLGLNIGGYALDFFHPLSGIEASYPLTGASHHDIMKWLTREFEFCGIEKPFQFHIPYEISNAVFFEEHVKFPLIIGAIRTSICELKSRALETFKHISNHFSLTAEVLVLPHTLQSIALLSRNAVDGNGLELGLLLKGYKQFKSPCWYVELSMGERPSNSLNLLTGISDGWEQSEGYKLSKFMSAEEANSESVMSFYLDNLATLNY